MIRPIHGADAEACGHIAFEAHSQLAAAHNYPSEQPSAEFSIGLIRMKIGDPNAWGAVVERDGQIVGSIFLNFFPPGPVAAIGPLTVKPSAEGKVGSALMAAALQEAKTRGYEKVRLVQSPSHLRSLALYSKMGFDVREPLVLMQGQPMGKSSLDASTQVRPANREDIAECNRLCETVHGFSREFELVQAIQEGVATVVERAGRLSGYSAGVGIRGYAVAESTDDLKAMISFAPRFLGPGFFVPIRNGELLRWLLSAGLKIGWPANLMTLGEYREPQGAFLPAIAY